MRGTFLQNREYLELFYREAYTIVEMEAGPYLSAIYEATYPERHPFDDAVHFRDLPFAAGEPGQCVRVDSRGRGPGSELSDQPPGQPRGQESFAAGDHADATQQLGRRPGRGRRRSSGWRAARPCRAS